jgi:cytochrome c biogenesis protein CcdA/tetratricopeptide (TPR) repeat protein
VARASLVEALLSLDQPDAAAAVAAKMQFEAKKFSVLGRIAMYYAAAGQYDKAVAVARGTPGEQGAAINLSSVVRECAQRRDYDEATKIIEKWLGDNTLRDRALDLAAQAAARNSDLAAAKKFAAKMSDAAGQDRVLASMAPAYMEGCAKEQRAQRAAELEQVASGIRTPAHRAQVLFAVAQAYFDTGNMENARRVGKQLAQLPYGERVTGHALNVAVLLSKLGDKDNARVFYDKALAEAKLIGCGGCRGKTLANIRQQMVANGFLDVALTSAREMQNALESAPLLLDAACRYMEAGRPEEAHKLVAEALEAAKNIRGTQERINMLALLGGYYERLNLPWGEREAKVAEALLAATEAEQPNETPLPITSTSESDAYLLYFFVPGCPECEEVEELLDELKKADAGVHVESRDLLTAEDGQLNKGLCVTMHLPDGEHLTAPAVFSSSGALVRQQITMAALLEMAKSARGQKAPWWNQEQLRVVGQGALQKHYLSFTPWVVIAAGLGDGINPCAFAVIIFFVTYMAYAGKTRKEIALAGILYTVAVFATYFAIGLGLHRLLAEGLSISTGVRLTIFVIMAALLAVAAVLSLRDGILCLGGRTDKVALKLPDAFKRKIRLMMTQRTRQGLTVFGALSLGVLVALLEFPCTGQVYAPIVMYISLNPVDAIGWLLLYNICFIVPLVVLFLCILLGVSSERISGMFQRHIATTKFVLAAVFAGLLVVLLITMR